MLVASISACVASHDRRIKDRKKEEAVANVRHHPAFTWRD
jgi:hypothetical protein